ncbi:MAG: aconitase X catalytic domain-containing protein [Desulfitobacterium hafniense]|nr:aconitase X catalytic domain-containing protein [Desulfitobacterium hafniense]
MELNQEQKEMLEGKHGDPKKKAMEILVQLGEIYGAKRMVPITSVHMAGSSVVVAGKAGTKLVEQMAAQGGEFVPVTTLNSGACDMASPGVIGFPEDLVKMQERLTNAYCEMGAISYHSCTPYYSDNVPKPGAHVAWGESSAIIFANSVLGARTNREGGPTGLAAALTGYVPEYGFHLDENRRGQVLVKVEEVPTDINEFGTLGYYVGQICGDRVPVFLGIEKAKMDELKMLGAALASSGACALFHIVGLTPEAPTLEAAMGGLEPEQEVIYGLEQKREAMAKLNKAPNDHVDMVVIGCPHASISELQAIAELFKTRRVKKGIQVWILTPVTTKALAERMGLVKIIEEAGAQIVCDTCIILAPMKEVMAKDGLSSVSTNSAKLAHYAPGQWGFNVHYGSLERCIESAVTGRWK